MADRSLRGWRLAVLSSMFVLSGLSLSYDKPDLRSPGRDEGEGGSRKYCPYCYKRLTRRSNDFLFCRDCGAVSEDQALNSPPPRS